MTARQSDAWPDLPYERWKETCATLQLWTQIVGKIRLARTPWVNHSWHVPLYVTARGLTTSAIPYDERVFELAFDFVDHALVLQVGDFQETKNMEDVAKILPNTATLRVSVRVP